MSDEGREGGVKEGFVGWLGVNVGVVVDDDDDDDDDEWRCVRE